MGSTFRRHLRRCPVSATVSVAIRAELHYGPHSRFHPTTALFPTVTLQGEALPRDSQTPPHAPTGANRRSPTTQTRHETQTPSVRHSDRSVRATRPGTSAAAATETRDTRIVFHDPAAQPAGLRQIRHQPAPLRANDWTAPHLFALFAVSTLTCDHAWRTAPYDQFDITLE